MTHVIKTDRLDLQPIREADFDYIRQLRARPEYYQYENDGAYSADETAKQFAGFFEGIKKLPNQGAIQWVVIHNGVQAGEVHLRCNWEKTLEWEIGWHFLREHWGKGLATEAARAVLSYAFANFKANRIMACLNAENARSAALCERIGMLKEGRLRETRLINGVYCDEYIYGILKREFVSSK